MNAFKVHCYIFVHLDLCWYNNWCSSSFCQTLFQITSLLFNRTSQSRKKVSLRRSASFGRQTELFKSASWLMVLSIWGMQIIVRNSKCWFSSWTIWNKYKYCYRLNFLVQHSSGNTSLVFYESYILEIILFAYLLQWGPLLWLRSKQLKVGKCRANSDLKTI